MSTVTLPRYPSYSFDPGLPDLSPSHKAKARKAHRDQMTVLADFQAAMRVLDHEDWLAFDLETGGLNPRRDPTLVVGLYGPKTNAAGILHFPRGIIPDSLIEWLEGRKLAGHNITRFDQLFMMQAGMDTRQPEWYDTLIGEQVATQSTRKGVKMSLKQLIGTRLGREIPKDVDHGTWRLPSLTPEQLRYVADDLYYVPWLMQNQWERAAATDTQYQAMDEETGLPAERGVRDAMLFEQELAPVVAQMMSRGLPINVKALQDYTEHQRAMVPEHERWLHYHLTPHWPGKDAVNMNSYGKLVLAFNAAFGTQIDDTKKDTLKSLQEAEGLPAEAAARLLRWRHGTKRESMYDEDFIEAYIDYGRLYGQFTQCGTDTGRFSSWQPNLQQLPRDMRYVIDGTPTGETIIAIDYSAIEVCVAAALYPDPALLEAVKAEDIHTMVATIIFGVEPHEVTKELRRLAKASSFGLLFGGGYRSLYSKARADGSTSTFEEVKTAGERFLGRFTGVRDARHKAYQLADSGRPVPIKFPTGLRRVLVPGVDLKGTTILNNSVQGTAAAGLKKAVMLMDERGLSQYLCAVVHDETVSVAPDAIAHELVPEIQACMVEGMLWAIDCPVRTEAKVGKTWQ
jgi:DNA polymerase-1